jgi:lipopolysaccharide biosynthesis glycosyltransferase
MLAGDYDRLLYLDSDIWLDAALVRAGGGFPRLMAADLGGAVLAAVRDNTQWRTPTRRNPEFRALGRPARPYLNAGVLLVDCAAWVAAEMEDRLVTLWRDQGGAMSRHDQSLLNVALDGNWAELSPVWNWQWTWSSRHFADMAAPRLIHFIGRRKPWTEAGRTLPPRFRATFAAFAARHWPDRTDIVAADPLAPGWPDDLRRGLVKHWFAAPAMRRYLARFPDAYTTRRP